MKNWNAPILVIFLLTSQQEALQFIQLNVSSINEKASLKTSRFRKLIKNFSIFISLILTDSWGLLISETIEVNG